MGQCSLTNLLSILTRSPAPPEQIHPPTQETKPKWDVLKKQNCVIITLNMSFVDAVSNAKVPGHCGTINMRFTVQKHYFHFVVFPRTFIFFVEGFFTVHFYLHDTIQQLFFSERVCLFYIFSLQ